MNIKNETDTRTIPLKLIFLCIGIISIISILLKLITADFTFPVNSDSLAYSLAAISHTNGDFSQSSHRGIGWSLFVSLFYSFIETENFIIYSNTIKILSISISIITISIVYLIGRKFFNEKYSLVVATLFAFEPHLNYNSGFGLSEPIFHFAIATAFYFLINKNTKFIIPSLFFAGIIFWIRFNGISFFIILVIIYLITRRNSPNFLRNLTIGIMIFLIVISPMLLQRANQFDDPFYFAYTQYIFTGSFEKVISIEYAGTTTSSYDYIEENGFLSFIQTFFINGIFNTIVTLWKILFPYLFILVPFGIIFSFRAFDQEKKKITANWLFIILSLGFLILTFSLIPEKRYLYFIFPFLIIFSVIPLQRVTEYGLSTFSFSDKQKTIFLVIILSAALLLSLSFCLRYDSTDVTLESEKYDFGEYVIQNLNGNSLREWGGSLDYLRYIYVEKSPQQFFNCDVEYNKKLCGYNKENGFLQPITITGSSVNEIISKGQSYDLKYIFVNKEKNNFHGFIDDIYSQEENYPYLTKIFDSTEYGYEKLEIKVFEIDYKKFFEYLKIQK